MQTSCVGFCRWRGGGGRRHYNTIRPHSRLGCRPPPPETATPPRPVSGSAPLHLRPAVATETLLHQQSHRVE
ncbi:hypothetical protein HLH28_12105 [Gluconacetobacter tumulisoli]|uniref:Transposase n=1 Tax=Gluconacetobacter tumulisoli TaxID=1286189 RepID=A0A7W4K8M1_9PROT|nr:hypothetical protein [Gluconacetobacter tumulisoli]